MSNALSTLVSAIQLQVIKYRVTEQSQTLAEFRKLRQASDELEAKFERAEKAPEPPREKRRLAISKFRLAHPLNRSEWRMVFAGLADKDDADIPLLEDDQQFVRVHHEVKSRIQQQRLGRRDWLALCFSYFGYESETPDSNRNWCALREEIDKGFISLKQHQHREKEWMRIVERYRELFTKDAGNHLGEQMFNGEIEDLSGLQTIAQIPESSWLWRRIFAVMLSRIFTLDDDEFKERIPGLIRTGRERQRYMDEILSACLTRYHHAQYREQSCALLMQTALECWGNPQLRSKQNSWLQYVTQPVCAMVVAWFAKADLQHFFQLLQGDKTVDQARLFYWLRFANQMSYTRIVMGTDAWHDRSSDFAEFRNKNKGRFSKLTEAPSHINAVVMQIGAYFFVEFSGTGNACFAYRADKAPFDPERPYLGMNSALKCKGQTVKWMPHTPPPRSPTLIEGWLRKFDGELSQLGIILQPEAAIVPISSHPDTSTGPIASTGKMGSTATTPSSHPAPPLESFEVQLKAALQHVYYRVYDLRPKGGVFKVELAWDDAQAKAALVRLGFRTLPKNPLMFWRY